MRLIATSLLILSGTYAFAQANDVESKIQAAMTADIRTEAEMGRDRNRKAPETLAFFQLKDDIVESLTLFQNGQKMIGRRIN